MNATQKAQIVELGFGNILKIKTKEFPSTLAYWVVDNFDYRDCALQLAKGKYLLIEEEDVYRVFGFPRGKKQITRRTGSEGADLLVAWYEFFENRSKISHAQIVTAMLAETEGGVWFKRHFLVLVVASLIENTNVGYITAPIMNHFLDVDDARNLDWGDYVISSLISTRSSWESRKRNFCGPTLFLMIFYVDRIKSYVAEAYGRKYPAISNWDYATLRARENDEFEAGGFGYGKICLPIDVPEQEHFESVETGGSSYRLQESVTEIIKDASEIAKKLVAFVEKLKSVPAATFDDETFMQTMEHTHKLIGYDISQKARDDKPSCSEMRQSQLDDIFWGQDDVCKAIDEIVKAVIKRQEYIHELDDAPTFSLGISQMFAESPKNSPAAEHAAAAANAQSPEQSNFNLDEDNFIYSTPNREEQRDDQDVQMHDAEQHEFEDSEHGADRV